MSAKHNNTSLSVLTVIFPGEPGLASFIGAEDESNHHHNKPTPNFLQAGCPSCCPTNSVRSLTGKGTILKQNHGQLPHINCVNKKKLMENKCYKATL